MGKQIFVVGLRRGGTSVTAGVLHTLGVHMGDVLHDASPSNEKGHFEDRKLQDLLDRLVGPWSIPKSPHMTDNNERAIKEYVDTYTEQHEVWGGKDPKLCFGVGPIALQCENPMLITPIRPFEESVRSTMLLNNLPRPVAEKLLSEYFLWRDLNVRFCLNKNYPVFEFSYGDMCNYPEETIEVLVKFLDLEPTEEQFQNAIDFIDPSLRHHNV